MSSIKLKHSSGNGVSIEAPATNPAADRTITLPADADGTLVKSGANTVSTAGDVGYSFENSHTTSGFGFKIKGGGTDADRYIVRFDDAAGNERARINANGNVGIGTASPAQLLTVKGLSKFEASNSTNGWVNYTYTDNTYRFNYNGAGNDEVILTSDGNMGLGMTPQCTTGNILNLTDTYFIGFGDGGSGRPDFQIGTTGGSTLDFRCGFGSDDSDLSIATNGVFTGDFNDTSDERLKDNIQDISANQINIVKQLRPVTFDWKDTDKGSNTGFIAQEVIKLLPNDVTCSDPTNTNSNLGINNMGLTAVLTAALQEAIAKIETLEAKVAVLEAA